jgi:hypothetical protein
MRKLSIFALAAIALCASACKKKSEAIDAGQKNEISDQDLGFHLDLLPNWVLAPSKDATILGEARRKPNGSKPYLVPPRLVVTALPGNGQTADQLGQATLDDLKKLEQRSGVRINRTSTSLRVKDGISVCEVEVSYTVTGDKRDTAREVVHRSMVTKRARSDGSDTALTFTATFLAEDSEAVSPEVYQMFAALGFDERPGTNVGPAPRVVARDAGGAR